MIEQFTYTASPWGGGGSGWMVFQKTQSLNENSAKALYQSFNYEAEASTADGGGVHQLQFVYHAGLNGAGAVMSQTAYVGKRWWGEERPGDFFAHVLLADEKALCCRDFNPICYFMSEDLQTAFPETLKEKALKIYSHELPYSSPPPLAHYDTFDGLRRNVNYGFDAVLDRIGNATVLKIGFVVERLVAWKTGDAALVFDSTKDVSLDVMALALHLSPVKRRRRLWFATCFGESALKQLPDFHQFAFYGTVRNNAPSDPGTGLFERLAESKLRFESKDEIRHFKGILDRCGESLEVADFDKLVDFWRISKCGDDVIDLLKSSGEFVKKNKQALGSELLRDANELTGDRRYLYLQILCVARYDLNIVEILPRSCFDAALVPGAFEGVMKCLERDSARVFENDLYEYAKENNCLSRLADEYLSLKNPDELRGIEDDSFWGRVMRYKALRNNERPFEVADVAAIEKLLKEVDGRLEGIANVRAEMLYCKGLAKLKTFDDLQQFLSIYSQASGIDAARVERDIIARLGDSFAHIEPRQICQMIRFFDNAGLSSECAISRMLEAKNDAVKVLVKNSARGERAKLETELEGKLESSKVQGWFWGFATAIIVLCALWGAKKWLCPEDAPRLGWERREMLLRDRVNSPLQSSIETQTEFDSSAEACNRISGEDKLDSLKDAEAALGDDQLGNDHLPTVKRIYRGNNNEKKPAKVNQ